MQKVLATIISVLFHPLIMPTVGIFLLFNSNTYFSILPSTEKEFIYYIIIGCTFALPLIITPFFIFNNIIKDITINDREERKIPLFITLGFYYFAYHLLKKVNVPDIIITYSLGCFLAVGFTCLINLKYKISLHTVGIGGLTGFILTASYILAVNMQVYLMIIFLIAGLIGYARLKLNAHNPFQIYSGYFLGLLTMILTFVVVRI